MAGDDDVTVGWDVSPLVAGWDGLPSLDDDATADVCIVGLGGSGLAAVEDAAARGLSVVGLDAGRIAAGAAGRNGGFLLAGSALFLHDAIERWGDCAVDLYRATLAERERLATTLPDIVRRTGSIRLAGVPGDPRDADEVAEVEREVLDLAAHAAALRAHGIDVDEYGGDLGTGILMPDDAAVNPAERAVAVARSVRGRARLYEGSEVVRVDAGTVVTAGGTVSAGAVVIAVDGGLERIVPELSGRVRTARLQMLATEPLPARLPCPVYGRWGYDYAQQTPDGRMFLGGGRDRVVQDEWTHDAAPSQPVQAYLDAIAPRFAGRPVRVTHRWAASVGFTDDGRALCTPVADGVVAAGGYSGTGNLVGPVAARAALALALDGTPPPPYLAS